MFAAILSSVVIGALALQCLSLLLGAWAAQETWHVVFPTQYRALFRTLYFRNVLNHDGWPLFSMIWVFCKAALSALLAAVAAIMVALGPKTVQPGGQPRGRQRHRYRRHHRLAGACRHFRADDDLSGALQCGADSPTAQETWP